MSVNRAASTSARAAIAALTGTVLAGLLIGGLSVAAPAAAAAPRSAVVPGGAVALHPRVAVTALADLEPLPLTLAIPDGLTPVRLTAAVVPTTPGVGTVQVSQRGELLAEATLAATDEIDVPLDGVVVVDGELVLDVGYLVTPPESRDFCRPPLGDTVTLSDVALWVTGEPQPPTTVADFLAPGVNTVVVAVPDDADENVVEAALDAVGSAAAVLPNAGDIDLVPESGLDVDDPLARVISIQPGTGDVQTSFDETADVPTLVMRGDPAELPAAARALGSDLLPLADDQATIGLGIDGVPTERLARPLSDFAGDELLVSGYGENRRLTSVPEDAFGGPVSQVDLHLVGSATRLPGEIVATAGIYWNDYLVDSFVLGDLARFERDITVPGDRLAASNTMTVRLSATPDFGRCRATTTVLPVEVHIDTAATTLTATSGQTLPPSFARFPQVLSGSLPVGFGAAGVSPEALGAACDIVAAMQRISWQQLDVDVVTMDEFAADARSGLVVGAQAADSTMLSSPLRLDEFRTVSTTDLGFSVGVDKPYAALQAFDHGGRTVVMLGSWSPDGAGAGELEAALGDWVGEQQYGWFELFSDLVVTGSETADPVTLAASAIVPQQEVVEGYGFQVWWVIAIVGALVVIGLIGALLRRRRARRIRALVEAQQAADRDALSRRALSRRHGAQDE